MDKRRNEHRRISSGEQQWSATGARQIGRQVKLLAITQLKPKLLKSERPIGPVYKILPLGLTANLIERDILPQGHYGSRDVSERC